MSRRRAAAAKPAAALALVVTATALTSCGNDDRPLPTACTTGPRPIARALQTAPGPVRLAGGTRISSCVERARTDADIQTVGSVFTRTADGLASAMPASDGAALRLGYLIAAVRRGARHTNGIHEELVRRVEQTVGLDGAPGPRRAAFDRGLAAGGRDG